MKEKYFKVKNNYIDYIVFINSGNFWNVFYKDAVIMHYITNYKISSSYKLGLNY